MTDDKIKVFHPEVINETPLPNQTEADFGVQTAGGQTYYPTEIPDNPFPERKVANELISSSLNTKSKKILAEYQFTPHGAIQIGKYQSGKSGDIRISPDGLVGRNKQGQTTFAIDGDTGDATFLGRILAGSVITTTISADYIKAGTLTVAVDVGVGASGAYVRLDGVNNRIIIHDGSNPRIVIGNI